MFPLLQIDSAQAIGGFKSVFTGHLGLLGGILFSAIAGVLATAGSKAKGWVNGHRWIIPAAQIPLALITTKLVALGFPDLAAAISDYGSWVGVSVITAATGVGTFSTVKNVKQSFKTGG